MKKHVLFVAVALGLSVSANAQDENYLPEAGDWGLGFDANPLINYAGNLFNGTSGNSMNAAWENGMNAIFGRYFMDESHAVRGYLRLGFGSTTEEAYVDDVTSTSTPPEQVTDSWKSSYSAIVLGGGYEIRRGGPRLQGYYGPALSISLMGGKDTYEYGNTLTDTYTNHVSQFGQGTGLLEDKAGSTFGLGLGGFIGVEFFILPKISIGAEYFWGLMMSSTGEGMSTSEYYDVPNNRIETTETTTAGGSSFGIDTDNNGGSIRLMFHF